MVARTPPKQRRQLVAPLNPVLVRETLKKVEKSIARLQELQYTVTGGNKVIGGVSLSPRSTRGYLRTSIRCKQESLRIGAKKSPVGKLPASSIGEWRRMSLPAMLLGETMGEILQASQFARELVEAVENKTKKHMLEDPKTPMLQQRRQSSLDFDANDTELRSKRKKEKQNKLQSNRSESGGSPSFQRARSRINFKVSPPKKREVESGGSPSFQRSRSGINVKVSPTKMREIEKENCRYLANKVSPRHKPWVKKTVLFPNPLFLSADSMQQQQKFCRTRSPVIARTKQTPPHKFFIKSPKSGAAGTSKFQAKIKTKSPPLSASKFQVKIKNPPIVTTLSPTRASLSRKSPKISTAAKLRRSFSPSRLANRLVSLSPLKTGKNVQSSNAHGQITGLKQRPAFVASSAAMPRRFSLGRIRVATQQHLSSESLRHDFYSN